MTIENIIKELKVNFDIRELVSKRVYNVLGETSWCVFDKNTLWCLLVTRILLGTLTINDWKWNGTNEQRGFRENLSYIVQNHTKEGKLYLSGHPLGKAFDIIPKNMTAEEGRQIIDANQALYPCKIRLEHLKENKPITWIHLDTKYYQNNPKVYYFNV